MRTLRTIVLLMTLPALGTAQSQAVGGVAERQEALLARLHKVLTADIAAHVLQVVTDATSRGLPGLAIADRALEGAAKGRSGEEIRATAHMLARELAGAQGAIQRGGRAPDPSEVAAAATAMALGVDGEAVSKLATFAPSGRSLIVPLTVLGTLVNRGLPVDDVLVAVRERLQAHAGNGELIDMTTDAGRLLANGRRPAEVGLALASARSGRTLPAGPPAGVPRNNGGGPEHPQWPPQTPKP